MVGVYSGVVVAPTAMVRAMLGVDAHARIRRAHVLVISIAFGIIAARLLDVHPVPASTTGQLAFWALPAVTVAVVIGAVLVVASGSDRSLALLALVGLPEIDARHRARANGLVWSAIALLMVHFTAPAFAFVPGGPIIVGVVFAAGLGYGTMRLHLAAIEHEAYRSFNLVAMLLAAGSLASMSITPTGEWWTHNFSTLGTSDDLAAACFNVAVTMAGLGMALLGPALSSALRLPGYGLRRGGLTTIRVLIAFIGVSLMGVGLVPIDGATVLHNVFACGAAAGFAFLALGVQLWARRMPRGLVVFSYAALTVEIGAMVAYDGLKLFNLTVFEIVAFTLVFAWLIALVATTAGAAARAEADQPAVAVAADSLDEPGPTDEDDLAAVASTVLTDTRHVAPHRVSPRTPVRTRTRPGTRPPVSASRSTARASARARDRAWHTVDA